MAITQVALRPFSRELNGRTLTATFTDDMTQTPSLSL